MRKALASIVGVLAFCTIAQAAGHVMLGVGSKMLNKDDWDPIQSQLAFGVNVDYHFGNLPVDFEAGYWMSGKTDGDYEGSTSEITIGVRKYMPLGSMQAYGNAGLALASAKVTVDVPFFGSVEVDGSGTGFYLGGGAYMPLAEKFMVGLDLRYTMANADFSGTDVKAGGLKIAVVGGMSF